MNGSKKFLRDMLILKNTEKIIFVSEWVRERFFLDLDKKLMQKQKCLSKC